MPIEVPDPRRFRGVPLRSFLEAVASYLLRTRLIAGPGIRLEESPGGTILKAGGGSEILWAKAPGAGIAARHSGTVTLYSSIETGTLSAVTVTAKNVEPDAIPANVLLAIEPGTLRILTWSCAVAPSTPMS